MTLQKIQLEIITHPWRKCQKMYLKKYLLHRFPRRFLESIKKCFDKFTVWGPAVCILPYLVINWDLNGFATWPSWKVLCEIALKSVTLLQTMQTYLQIEEKDKKFNMYCSYWKLQNVFVKIVTMYLFILQNVFVRIVIMYLFKLQNISVKIIRMHLLYRGERIVFSGPNRNTNTIRVQKFGRIRIRILFGVPLLSKYEYEYLDYSNNTR